MTVGSLFSGIGGMDLGLERAGMRVLWQSEIDPYASRVLARHWPTVPNLGDITRVDWAAVARPDLVCGGFPCQDISFAGKGAGLSGARSGLWWEFARCVREVRPRYVLVENVAALLVRGLDAVLGTLASLGYDAEWHIIPAAALGAPHIRERVFVLAHARHAGTSLQSSGSACEAGEQGEGRYSPAVPSLRGRLDVSHAHGPRLSVAQSERELRGPVAQCDWWATEPDVGRVADGIPFRLDRLRCLGNAVVPQVAEWIGRRLIEPADDEGAF